MKTNLLLSIAIALLIGCTSSESGPESLRDPLPSWNEGTTRTSIIEFVQTVTDENHPDFIPVPDRVAVFDNDGTLWSEQPLYFQFFFAIDRVNALSAEHPEWKEKQPFKAILENDQETIAAFGLHDLIQVIMASHAGLTTDEFEAVVKEWIRTAKHPQKNRSYTGLVYQPMLELLDYLRANGFKTFIVSGGGIEFMRPWVEEIYGIPRDQVVGSSIKTEFVIEDGAPKLIRLPEMDFINDKEGKPVGINRFIGRRPVFCAGNSDGDLQMMQWTASGATKFLNLYVHHTDSDREWAYDRESHVGRFDKALDEATAKGWTLVSMKDDWKVILPAGTKTE